MIVHMELQSTSILLKILNYQRFEGEINTRDNLNHLKYLYIEEYHMKACSR